MPRVSVCCAVLNQSEWLREMIGSVWMQTYKDWELIVVDDGSTEDIKAVCDSFKDDRIIYLRFHKNRGVPHGINHAMRHAKGEFINPLAADELITPDKLETQVAYMDANPDIHAIWGLPGNGQVGLRPEWEQNQLRAHNRSKKAWVRTLMNLENVPIGGASMLARKECFETLGYFDQNLTLFSDHEWFVRFFKSDYEGRILPYRWALSRPNSGGMAKEVGMKGYARELNYLKGKHRIEVPNVDKKITIGIAVYNMAHYIPDALESLFKQTLQPTEILIVDDCSTDNIAEVVASYKDPRIKFFKMEENGGNMRAQNFMMMKAEGTFYVPFAADDTLSPDYLEKVHGAFVNNPWLEFCASQTDFMDASGKIITERPDEREPTFVAGAMNIAKAMNQPREKMLAQLYYGNVYFGVGMYRTQTLRDVGGWEPGYGVLSDYEMYLRLLQREAIQVIEEPLTHTRLHDKNMSNLAVNKPGRKTLKELYADAKKPYFAPRMKVIIATPFYEMRGFSPYISSLVHTIRALTMLGIEHEFWELPGDSYVSRARNTICAKFLEDPEATDLFFIDSDMHWDVNAFLQMLMLPEEVVGGSYPAKNQWEMWTSFPKLEEVEGALRPRGRYLPDGSALLEAETVAAGFLRMKRSVLERFRDTYKEHTYLEPCADQSRPDRLYTEFFATGKLFGDGLWYGEDRAFCRRLIDMKVPIYIYPNVNMGHYGIKAWTGNFHQYLARGKEKRAN